MKIPLIEIEGPTLSEEEILKDEKKLEKNIKIMNIGIKYLFPICIGLLIIDLILFFMMGKKEICLYKFIIIVYAGLLYFNMKYDLKLIDQIKGMSEDTKKVMLKVKQIFRSLAEDGIIFYKENNIFWNPKGLKELIKKPIQKKYLN